MRGIERGTIKYLRIAEQTQWFENKDNVGSVTWSPGPIQNSSFSHWTWSPVRVVGTVPVEKDGSAYFKVPVGLPVYFQALDENRMEVRRMRSHIEFKPGEQERGRQ